MRGTEENFHICLCRKETHKSTTAARVSLGWRGEQVSLLHFSTYCSQEIARSLNENLQTCKLNTKP